MAYGKNEKVAKRVVNLTTRSFSIYEDSTGKIVTFDPSHTSLPPEPRHADGEASETVYVVSRETFQELKRAGAELDDIAFVNERGVGRNGHEICRLVWAKNPDVYVRLRTT